MDAEGGRGREEGPPTPGTPAQKFTSKGRCEGLKSKKQGFSSVSKSRIFARVRHELKIANKQEIYC